MLLELQYYDFPPAVIFHSRVIGACPVTPECVVVMNKRENNNNDIRAEGAYRERVNASDMKMIPGTTPFPNRGTGVRLCLTR